jgi:prepilin-type N-terminal cleavage/methylation domain-containing protein
LALKKTTGFTLIELLVALVVAGLLMASLVGISGAVQKSIGRTKDISELQTNLRFAMKLLVDDFTRVGFMYSPNPAQDRRTVCPLPANFVPAITYSLNQLRLIGNFISSRDYWFELSSPTTGTILCRNGVPWDAVSNPVCQNGDFVPDKYMIPFVDGPGFGNLFYPGAAVRVDVGGGNYCYGMVGNTAGLTVTLNTAIDRNEIQGQQLWINPVTTITYAIRQDGTYLSRYAPVGANNQRWMLNRSTVNVFGNQTADIADFLLPQANGNTPGLSVDFIRDAAGQAAGAPVRPNIQIQPLCNLIPQQNACADPVQARAAVITLRARTEMEDPDFTINNYAGSSQAGNMGIDLDGIPEDGLAHVRTVQTVVEMRNLGATQL